MNISRQISRMCVCFGLRKGRLKKPTAPAGALLFAIAAFLSLTDWSGWRGGDMNGRDVSRGC